MTATASVSIDRASLSLPPLVISGGAAEYTLTPKGLGRPATTIRRRTARSHHLHGEVVLSAVKETSALPLEVLVQGTSSTNLATLIDDLDEALFQFSYSVTVSVDGVSRTWLASPASWGIAGGLVNQGNAAAFCEVLTITIPVYPIPGTV